MNRFQTLVAAAAVFVATGSVHAEDKTKQSQRNGEFETERGDGFSYGLDLAVIRVRASRRSDEPARARNYQMGVDLIPGAIGFHVTYRPNTAPWRLQGAGDNQLQLFAPTFILLFDKASRLDQSTVSLGIGIAFFDERLSVIIACDLYRGVPVRSIGSDSGTAYTGLLSWAWSSRGEITAENTSLILNLSLLPVVNALAGGDNK